MSVQRLTGGIDQEQSTVLLLLLLLSVWIVTGLFVAAAFLLPQTVGALISGQALLALGMTFAGATLALVAATPGTAPGTPGAGGAAGSANTPVEPVRNGDDPTVLDRLRATHAELDGQVVYPVVLVAAASTGSFLLWPEGTRSLVDAAETIVLDTGRPLLHGAVLVFVLGVLWLAVGDSGRIRFGGDDATPEYSDGAYLAMLFSAGIAAGIVFWGPAEALFHYDSPPPYVGAESGSAAAIDGALTYSLFHWGVSAWSAYLIVGLPIAYAVYNRGAQLRVSAMLAPLLGTDVVERPLGKLVDVLAVLATLGGLSTTLGFLSAQFLTGIEFHWSISLDPAAQVLFVGGLTGIVIVSVLAGLRQGMRRLSVLNSGVFLFVLVILALVGPTLFILENGGQAVLGYLANFLPMSLYTGDSVASGVLPGVPETAAGDWLEGWTSFYWAWWLSWAPFVGLFIARISRGRRIRTVVFAAGIVTSIATLTWFVVAGATALELQHTGAVDLLAVMSEIDTAVAGYPLFEALPLGNVLLIPFLLLVITFFITSADAATRSLALMTARDGRPSPLLHTALALAIGVIAISLILFGDGAVLQSAAVLTGGPFAVLGLVALFGLVVAVRAES
jgi:glycine betaine transporter